MTRKMKKIASLVLAVSMLLSCLAFNSSAAGTPTGEEAMSVGLSLSAESAEPGDIITVTISISNNYNATSMRWPVYYSTAFFEVVEDSLTTPIDSAVSVAGRTTTTDNSGFVSEGYADTHSAFVIQWYANPTDDASAMGAFNSGVAAECFTFQLKVLDTASGTGTVLIPEDSEYFYDSAIDDVTNIIDGRYEADDLVVTVSNPVTVTLAVAAEPELVATEGYSVRTIQFDGDDSTYICGFSLDAVESGGSFEDQFTVNNGSYTVSGDWGTGAVVTVFDASGAEYASYTVIVFGDMNGDAVIDGLDVMSMALYVSGDLEGEGDNRVYYYAADMYADNENSIYIDGSDVSVINLYISGDVDIASLNQTHVAQ